MQLFKALAGVWAYGLSGAVAVSCSGVPISGFPIGAGSQSAVPALISEARTRPAVEQAKQEFLKLSPEQQDECWQYESSLEKSLVIGEPRNIDDQRRQLSQCVARVGVAQRPATVPPGGGPPECASAAQQIVQARHALEDDPTNPGLRARVSNVQGQYRQCVLEQQLQTAEKQRQQQQLARQKAGEELVRQKAAEAAEEQKREEEQRATRAELVNEGLKCAESPRCIGFALSAAVCKNEHDRAEALREIREENKYAKIGGAVDLAKLHDLQDEVRKRDNYLKFFNHQLEMRKLKRASCKGETMEILMSCIDRRETSATADLLGCDTDEIGPRMQALETVYP